MDKPTVFISYNQASGDAVANEIEERLLPIAVVVRDKSSLSPWDSLTDFMKTIRRQDLVVLIVSDQYLKSTGCMFEVSEAMKDDDWNEKCMYVVADDAREIYNPLAHVLYHKFWRDKEEELMNALEKIGDPVRSEALLKEIVTVRRIQDNLSVFLGNIKDCYNPSVDIAIDAIFEFVSKESGKKSDYKFSSIEKKDLEDNFDKLQLDDLQFYNDLSSVLSWITYFRNDADKISYLLDCSSCFDTPMDRFESYKRVSELLTSMRRIYVNEKYIYDQILENLGLDIDLEDLLGEIVNNFISNMRNLSELFIQDKDIRELYKLNNKYFKEFYNEIDRIREKIIEIKSTN